MGKVPLASTGMHGASGVPKQSSRRNKGFLRDIIICVLLFLSDRCTHALPRASGDEGIEAYMVENRALKRQRSQGHVQLHFASKENDGALKLAVIICGENRSGECRS